MIDESIVCESKNELENSHKCEHIVFSDSIFTPTHRKKLFLKNLSKRAMDSIKRKSLFVETIEDQENYLFFSKYKNIPAVKNK